MLRAQSPSMATTLTISEPERATFTRTVDVEIVIPVYNEAHGLEASVRALHSYLRGSFPFSWLITIADNASSDATLGVALDLAQSLEGVRVAHLDQKGRGRALRATWLASEAAVVAYMDVDLSTSLSCLLPLVAPLVSGHSDVAIGTRLAKGAQVVRGPKRELISRCYNLILRSTMGASFTDAQCGFKAVRSDVARSLLPLVEDNAWFFDTELLVVAEYNGLRIHEVPVDWVDDPDSRVDIVSTATDDLKGIGRMLGRLAHGQIELDAPQRSAEPVRGVADQMVRFASIGIMSTVVASVLFVLLRPALGLLGGYLVSYLACAAWNVAAQRRYTFAIRGRAGRRQHWLVASLLGAGCLVASAGALLVASSFAPLDTAHALAVVTAANAVMTVVRFAALRRLFVPARDERRGA